jgi:hypothetical protein
LSFVYWGYLLLLKVQFGNGPQYSDCGDLGGGAAAAAAGAPCTPVPDLQAALQLPDNLDASPWLEGLVLLAMLVALRVIIYYVLRAKTRGRKLRT